MDQIADPGDTSAHWRFWRWRDLGYDGALTGRDEGNNIPTETLVAVDTPYWASDHTLPARIYHLPEDADFPHPVLGQDLTPSPTARRLGENNLPFEDVSIFDVTSESRTDPGLVELLRRASEVLEAPRESPVVAIISPPPEPPMSGGVAGISYLIQLGALPSKESARREWIRIERRHPDLVRNQFPTIVPVELNPQMGKVFRLRTGPIGEIKSARSLCRKFRSHGQDCFVVKFENPS